MRTTNKINRLQLNASILMEEVYNLLRGVGEGFIDGDYYTTRRYRSKIKGVKHICIQESTDTIFIKLSSSDGCLLPSYLKVYDDYFDVVIWYNNHDNEDLF